MLTIGNANILDLGIFNALVPKEGPKAVPLDIDLTVEQSAQVDLSLQSFQKVISFVQCLFVDNSANPSALRIQASTTRHTLVIPANSQAFVPIIATNPPVILFETQGGVSVRVHFLNVPMPLQVWSVLTQPQLTVDGNGQLIASFPAIENIITDQGEGPGLNVNVISGGGGGGGTGLRLPANYGITRGDFQTGITANLIAASPRFYVNAITISLDAGAYRSAGTDGLFTVTVYQGGSDKWARTVWLPGTAPAPGPTTVAPLTLLELTNLDWWSTVDAENLRIGLSASLGGASALRVSVAGGTGSVPA